METLLSLSTCCFDTDDTKKFPQDSSPDNLIKFVFGLYNTRKLIQIYLNFFIGSLECNRFLPITKISLF